MVPKQTFYENNFAERVTNKEIVEKIDQLRFAILKLYFEEHKKDNKEQYKIGYYRGKLDAYNQICDIMVTTGYNIKQGN